MPSVRWMPMRRGPDWSLLFRLAENEPELTEALQHVKFPDVRAGEAETDVCASVKIEEG